MLKKNYGSAEKIVEKLLEEAKAQKHSKNSNDFQEFSNLFQNLSDSRERWRDETVCRFWKRRHKP
jgi:hypothetical protein